jgi:molybdenum cofactor guanylyltransferase
VAAIVDVTPVVLAGGASRRMGTPKAQLEIGGQTLLQRILDALALAGLPEAVVVGGDQSWSAGATWVPDEYPNEGPLAGLVTALAHVSTPWILLLSCDLVAADPNQLSYLIEHANSATDVVVPDHLGKLQLLHALYRRSALTGSANRFRDGERRLGSVLDGLRVQIISATDELQKSVRDVDTPEEFQDAVREH